MIEVSVRKIGNSLGVILPSEAARILDVEEGDKLFLTKSPEGLLITSYDPLFKKKIKVARRGMKRYKNALRELAK